MGNGFVIMRCGLNKPVRNNMTMFIGLKIDEESTETIYRWLQRCARDRDMELQAPLPKRFIYIPLCYSGSNALNEDELRSHLAGKINVPINLKNLQINFLGERGNVSLIFQSDWIKERYQFWISKDRRLRQVVVGFCDLVISNFTTRQAAVFAEKILLPERTNEVICHSVRPSITAQAVSKTLRSAHWPEMSSAFEMFEALDWDKLARSR